VLRHARGCAEPAEETGALKFEGKA